MKAIIFKYVKHAVLGACMLIPSITAFSQGEWLQYDGGESIFRILKDGNNLWIAANSGLLQLDMETDAVTRHELGISDLPRLRNLAKDTDGNLWVTTQRNGVIKYDGRNVLERYNESNSSLANNQYCISIAIDAGNNKWIGSLLYLNKFDGSKWQAWTTPESAVANYWFISDLEFDRNGDLWLAGDAPEWHFAKFTGDTIQPVPEITKSVCEILIDGDNNKWLASQYQGLIKYDGTRFVTWNTENSDLPANDIYDIKQDASGNLWLACNKYLVQFDGNNFTNYPVPELQKTNERDFISSLELDDDGNVWLGTKQSGLFKFTRSEESFRSVSNPTAIPTVAGKNTDAGFFVRTADSGLSVGLLLAGAAKVSLTVSDLRGSEVVSLLKEQSLSRGNHSYSVSLPAGVYIVKYTANGKTVAEKVLIRDTK
jgi:ligand-binding sensor domain-containing protein